MAFRSEEPSKANELHGPSPRRWYTLRTATLLLVILLVVVATITTLYVSTLSKSTSVTILGVATILHPEGQQIPLQTSSSWPTGPYSTGESLTFSLTFFNHSTTNCTLVGLSVLAPVGLVNVSGPAPYYGLPAEVAAGSLNGTILWTDVTLPSASGSYVVQFVVDTSCG